MFLYKCINCGGWIDFEPGSTIAKCAFCGAKQEFPELAAARWEAFSKAEGASKTRRKKLKEKETNPLLRRAFLFLEKGEFAKADLYCERVLDQEPENAQAYLGKLMAEQEVRREEELSACPETFDDNDNYKMLLRYASPELATTMRTYNDYIRDRNEQDRKREHYKIATDNLKSVDEDLANADRLAKEANDLSSFDKCETLYRSCQKAYEDIAEQFGSIPGFRDADKLEIRCREQAKTCKERAEAFYKESLYLSAKNQMTGATKQDYIAAARNLRELSGYKDADTLLPYCEKKIEALEEAENTARDEAMHALEEAMLLARRKKKRKRICICLLGVLVLLFIAGLYLRHHFFVLPGRYRTAEEAFAEGNYEAAIEAFAALGDYRDSVRRISEVKEAKSSKEYALAEEYLAEEKYGDALRMFVSLKNYRDSAERSEEVRLQYYENELAHAKVGDEILFGKYEQDANVENGQEDIEWLVLDKEDGKMLVISKYLLAYRSFSGSYHPDITFWSTSSLRKWVNTMFYNSAFSEEEKALIQNTWVVAEGNPDIHTSQGDSTYDSVFLLSVKQAEKYFRNDEARKCKPTLSTLKEYGRYYSLKKETPETMTWWLRTRGYVLEKNNKTRVEGVESAVFVSSVNSDGKVNSLGYDLPINDNGVRPAIWIKCSAEESN